MEINITLIFQFFCLLFLFFFLSKKIVFIIISIFDKREFFLNSLIKYIKTADNIYIKQSNYLAILKKNIVLYKKNTDKLVIYETIKNKEFIFLNSKNYNKEIYSGYKKLIYNKFDTEFSKVNLYSESISEDILKKIFYV